MGVAVHIEQVFGSILFLHPRFAKGAFKRRGFKGFTHGFLGLRADGCLPRKDLDIQGPVARSGQTGLFKGLGIGRVGVAHAADIFR